MTLCKAFFEEMQQCKSVTTCVELALTDAYGEYERASAWLACIYSGAIEHFDVLRDAASGAQAAITALEAVRQSERPVEHRH